MPSLSSQLTQEYMDQFYKGSYFTVGGKIYKYAGHVNSQKIQVRTIAEDMGRPSWDVTNIPTTAIQTMDDFGWPELGYRQFDFKPGDSDKGVYFISTSRSAMRGLRDDFLQFSAMPVTKLFQGYDSPRGFVRDAEYVKEIFQPTFMDFNDGMDLIRNNKTTAFALSPSLAIGVACNQAPGREVDVFYKENVIGQVLSDNTVVVPKRIARRASSIRLFKGKVKS